MAALFFFFFYPQLLKQVGQLLKVSAENIKKKVELVLVKSDMNNLYMVSSKISQSYTFKSCHQKAKMSLGRLNSETGWLSFRMYKSSI